MATEANLVRKILQRLKSEYPMGVWYKIHTGPFQERGVPDILGCLRGRFIAFEVKTPDNKDGVTNYQKLQLDRIKSAEGKAVVVTSVKEVLKYLQKNFYKLRGQTKVPVLNDPKINPEESAPDHLQSLPTVVESIVEEGKSDGTESDTETPARKNRRTGSGKANRRKHHKP